MFAASFFLALSHCHNFKTCSTCTYNYVRWVVKLLERIFSSLLVAFSGQWPNFTEKMQREMVWKDTMNTVTATILQTAKTFSRTSWKRPITNQHCVIPWNGLGRGPYVPVTNHHNNDGHSQNHHKSTNTYQNDDQERRGIILTTGRTLILTCRRNVRSSSWSGRGCCWNSNWSEKAHEQSREIATKKKKICWNLSPARMLGPLCSEPFLEWPVKASLTVSSKFCKSRFDAVTKFWNEEQGPMCLLCNIFTTVSNYRLSLDTAVRIINKSRLYKIEIWQFLPKPLYLRTKFPIYKIICYKISLVITTYFLPVPRGICLGIRWSLKEWTPRQSGSCLQKNSAHGSGTKFKQEEARRSCYKNTRGWSSVNFFARDGLSGLIMW